MRLDDVEIKVTFEAGAVAPAVGALGLPAGRPEWQIFFCEGVPTDAGVATPLLDSGIVLRARAKAGEHDDVTVLLRPCRRSQLTRRWLARTDGFRVGADWAGTRRALAASYTVEGPDDVLAAVTRGERPIVDLFTRAQRDFLRECGAAQISADQLSSDALRVLPPVTAVRWPSVPGAPAALGVRAERWTVDDLDFLELSIVAATADAERRQAALTDFVASLGLLAVGQETKTRLVIEHLAGPRPAAG